MQTLEKDVSIEASEMISEYAWAVDLELNQRAAEYAKRQGQDFVSKEDLVHILQHESPVQLLETYRDDEVDYPINAEAVEFLSKVRASFSYELQTVAEKLAGNNIESEDVLEAILVMRKPSLIYEGVSVPLKLLE